MLQVWSSYSTSLMETEIKERLQFFFEEALYLKPNYLIIDLKESNYAISPQLFLWIKNKIIFPAQKIGIQRTAIVQSTDFITSLFTEKIFENRSMVNRRFFNEISKANDWLTESYLCLVVPEIQRESLPLHPK